MVISPLQAETPGEIFNHIYPVTENTDEKHAEDESDDQKGLIASFRAAAKAMGEFVSIITSPKRIGEMLMFIIAYVIGLFLDIILFVFAGIFAKNFLLMESMSYTPWAVTLWGYLWWLSLAFWGIALLYLASRFIQGKEVPGQTIRAFLLALMLNFMSLWLTELLISLLNQASWTIIEPAVKEIGAAFRENVLTPPFSQNLILKGFIGDLGEGGDGTLSGILLKGDWMNTLSMILIMTALIALGLIATLKFVATRFLLIFSPYYLIRIGFFNDSLETLAGFLNLYARTYLLQIIFSLTWIMCYRVNRSLAETGMEYTGGLSPDILTSIILWVAVFVVYKFWFVHARESTKHLITHLGGEQVLKGLQHHYDRGMKVVKGLPRAGVEAGAAYAARKGNQITQKAKEAVQGNLDERQMDRLYETGKMGMTPFSNVKLSDEMRSRFDPQARQEKKRQAKAQIEYWEYSDRLVKGYIHYDQDGNAVIFDEPPKDGINMGSWKDRTGTRKAKEKARERRLQPSSLQAVKAEAKEEPKKELQEGTLTGERHGKPASTLQIAKEDPVKKSQKRNPPSEKYTPTVDTLYAYREELRNELQERKLTSDRHAQLIEALYTERNALTKELQEAEPNSEKQGQSGKALNTGNKESELRAKKLNIERYGQSIEAWHNVREELKNSSQEGGDEQ